MLSRIKFEIDAVVNQILDHLPTDVWTSDRTTFFDPALGGGQFVQAIEQRLRLQGHSDANIRRRVMGFEESELHIRYAVNKQGLVGQYHRKPYDKFLELENNMKFDVIVGNPPFQKSDNEAKRWTLWDQFVKKSFELSSNVAMITPQSITSPGPFAMIKDRAHIINTDVSRHFNVGSTFCYFVALAQRTKDTTTLISREGTFERDIRELPFLPFVINETTLSQIDWLTSRQSRTWRRGELHTSNTELFTDHGKYRVIHTNAQEFRTNVEHANRTKIRVCVSLSGYPRFQTIQDCYVSQACVWTEFPDIESARRFEDECNGEEIQAILSTFKWSGWNSKEVIGYL